MEINNKSYWHYPRFKLANTIYKSFSSGLVNSFTLFAPRRMGKTEFLLNDLKVVLDKEYKVIYFSFYDGSTNMIDSFIKLLQSELKSSFFTKVRLKEISFNWCKFEYDKDNKINVKDMSIKDLLSALSYQSINSGCLGTVLLLDEIQELQYITGGMEFISGLRTALDVNKDDLKVLFTGSSQSGLNEMFSNKKAPFFHFSNSLELEKFGKEFTDFLAEKFNSRLGENIDKNKLYEVFKKLDFITAHIRNVLNLALIEPTYDLDKSYSHYIKQIYNPLLIEVEWLKFSEVAKSIYLWIKNGNNSFYGVDFNKFHNKRIRKNVGLTSGKIQYSLLRLLDKNEIRLSNNGIYECSNLLINIWLENNFKN